jgi:hypothetical protein
MSLPSAYEIQNYAEAAAWLLFGVLLAQAIWQRRNDGDDDSEQYDWATLTHCDLQALADGDAQTIQTSGHGDLYRLEAVDVEGNDEDK